MSIPWSKRKARLTGLLKSNDDDEDESSLALDRILHGQSVIGKTTKTTQIDSLRFGDSDLDVIGTLEYGQFGVIDVVNCKLDGRVYVLKSIEKRFALRTRDQCSPQFERDILLCALKTKSPWAPHLLCAFQTTTHLNIVMDYAEGGTLWDVLESSPLDGKISESDLRWWAPQVVTAIQWCHSQGFVHRDIKPHNFVLSTSSHVMLIDFGSAAPLLSAKSDGSQQIPKRYCLVPCGTCDYISPEILQAHEEALVALEMSDEIQDSPADDDITGGYGRETDWWSLGVMLYEMIYGVAPFFARDIQQTYVKIMDHASSLKFNDNIIVSASMKDLLRRFLTSAELRLGRNNVDDIQDHPFFSGVYWSSLQQKSPPPDLHLPQFTYSEPVVPITTAAVESESLAESTSRAFAFSALFQSSPTSSPGVALLNKTATPGSQASRSILKESNAASFIGFSWGPTADAFDTRNPTEDSHRFSPEHRASITTPRPLVQASYLNLTPFGFAPPGSDNIHSTPGFQRYPFATPMRPNALTPHGTLPRASTIRRTAPRRAVSDREAMKQLVDCVGMSARKKVLESGRKPRILTKFNSSRSRSSTLKELRFDRSVTVMNESGVSYRYDPGGSTSGSSSAMLGMSTTGTGNGIGGASLSISASAGILAGVALDGSLVVPLDEDSSLESDIPPSPSPSPRPGSAMSMMSKRSQTPTITGSYFLRAQSQSSRSGDSKGIPSPTLPIDPPWKDQHRSGIVLGRDITMKEGFSFDVLDDFQRRHTKLMQEIMDIGGRLDVVAVHINGR